ncbi:MAG: CehA/McbA family metallohydrolase [Planctomycetia bacterium]|nr:CehA/McbA family metallohydrolase [Planctomycetia bacterium]
MTRLSLTLFAVLALSSSSRAADLPVVGDVEGQPLAANASRLLKALDFLGAPLPADTTKALTKAIEDKDPKKIQEILDKHVLFGVTVNPEARVKVVKGPGSTTLQQAGWTPVLVKVSNDSTVKKLLKIMSPQSGERFSGRGEKNPKDDPKIAERFLQVEMFTSPPMTAELSGLKVEYAIALIYSSESGKREATIGFDLGQGNQDLGFRGETAVLFEVKPAIAVKVSAKDFDGKPTVARLTITDAAGHVYPPRAKRLAPDFFFQNQIYRPDGGTVLLPPGTYTLQYGRGPEYLLKTEKLVIVAPGAKGANAINAKLERWVNPADYGWFSGDHHIHAAGCAHYTNPSEGVLPQDMFLHVKGEGLNVGCCLTWGPCYDYQRKFFDPKPWERSEPFTILKYDVEVSGFGSQALGHVCLLNLRDQTFPGSGGTKVKGWPTWTTPLMKWAKEQGAVTGYAHSANGLGVNMKDGHAAKRHLAALDANKNGLISKDEATKGWWPLPEPFATVDANGDGDINLAELVKSMTRVYDKLPNLNVPEMNGIGAQEVCVTTAMGVCDFISAMDTARTLEWNCWYHIMNCGFPLKASGETDFPCISGSRVGQGRVYVQLGKGVDMVDYAVWCKGIAQGRSYVSDGYAHALEFKVGDKSPGFGDVKLDQGGMVKVTAKVAFGKDVALGTAPGAQVPVGDNRKVELVVNGKVVASKDVPADNKAHNLAFEVKIDKSSWVALRHYPQMHTNPVNVIVGGKPIRASKASAKWCIGAIEQLWVVRGQGIKADERPEAEKTFKQAIDIYKKIAAECADE